MNIRVQGRNQSYRDKFQTATRCFSFRRTVSSLLPLSVTKRFGNGNTLIRQRSFSLYRLKRRDHYFTPALSALFTVFTMWNSIIILFMDIRHTRWYLTRQSLNNISKIGLAKCLSYTYGKLVFVYEFLRFFNFLFEHQPIRFCSYILVWDTRFSRILL